MTKDAVKHCDTLYTFNFEKKSNETVVKTSESVKTFINLLTKQATAKREEEILPSSTKLAKIYFQHKLITVSEENRSKTDLMNVFFKDTVLDIHSTSSVKSYYISNIEWFCQMLNKFLNTQSHPHRKTEQVFDQIKSAIGSDVHLLTKRDFKNFQISREEVRRKQNVSFVISFH